MKKNLIAVAVTFAVLVAGIAVAGGDIATAYVKAASTTAPTLNTNGTPLNTSTGQPVTRALVTVYGVGDVVGGRVNMWRFVNDAGWSRDISNDCILGDGGYPLGVGFNAGAVTCAPITYAVNGNSSRIDATVSGLLQGDGGTGVAILRIETTLH